MPDELNNFSCCWQESTAERVLNTAQHIVAVRNSAMLLASRAATSSDLYDSIAKRFNAWRSTYPDARNTLRDLANRHTSVRFTFQKDYFALASKLDSILQSVVISSGPVTFRLVPHAKVFTEPDPQLRCDAPLIDQIGIVVPFQLGFFGTEYSGDLVLIMAMACGGDAPAFYLARKPRLQDVQPDLLSLTIRNTVVAQIQEHVQQELDKQTIDLGTVATLQNSGYSLSSLAARTGPATIGVNCAAIASTPGSSPLKSGEFPRPQVTIVDWADYAVEIIPPLFFDAMRGAIKQRIPAPLVFSEQVADVLPAPPIIALHGNVLHISGDVWCIDDFGDREDYGTHDLYSAIEWRTTTNPGEIQVYFKSFLVGRTVVFLSLPDLPLTTMQNVDRVEVTLESDLGEIAVRYRRS